MKINCFLLLCTKIILPKFSVSLPTILPVRESLFLLRVTSSKCCIVIVVRAKRQPSCYPYWPTWIGKNLDFCVHPERKGRVEKLNSYYDENFLNWVRTCRDFMLNLTALIFKRLNFIDSKLPSAFGMFGKHFILDFQRTLFCYLIVFLQVKASA